MAAISMCGKSTPAPLCFSSWRLTKAFTLAALLSVQSAPKGISPPSGDEVEQYASCTSLPPTLTFRHCPSAIENDEQTPWASQVLRVVPTALDPDFDLSVTHDLTLPVKHWAVSAVFTPSLN